MTQATLYEAVVNQDETFQITQSLLDQATMVHNKQGQLSAVIVDGHRFEVVCRQSKKKQTYLIKVEGLEFEVALKRPVQQLVDTLGFNKLKTQSQKILHSPMPGQVLHLNLSVGQLIEKGQDVITLEAMKMENTIQAPHEGVIKEIFVSEGETVAKGQKLIEID